MTQTWYCDDCDEENEWVDAQGRAWGFGDKLICKKCKAAYDTDWDYVGNICSDSYGISKWITGKVKDGVADT